MSFRIFVYLMVLASLPSCRLANPDSTLDDHTITSASQTSQASLGTGYDIEQEAFLGDCVQGTSESVGAQAATVHFEKAWSQEEIQSSFGFSEGAKARFGLFEGEESAKYATDTSSNDYSSSTTYAAVYRFKNAKLHFTGLSAVGQAATANETWTATCGHEFVQQITLGAALFITAKIEFATRSAKQSFDAQFQISGPFVSARAALETASKQFGRTASVTIRAYQMGGNISRITKIFEGAEVPITTNPKDPKGATANALLVCSMDRIDACLQVMSNALTYATSTTDPEAFPQQINFPALDVTAPNGPAMLAYETKPYSILAITTPSPIVDAITAEARQRLFGMFERTLRQAKRTRGLLFSTLRLTQPQRDAVTKVDDDVRANIKSIRTAAEVCWSKLPDCPDAVDTAQGQLRTVAEDALDIAPQGFAQYCDLARLPVHELVLEWTVSGLLDAAKTTLSSLGDDPCQAADGELAKRDKLLVSGPMTSLGVRNALDMSLVFLAAPHATDIEVQSTHEVRNASALGQYVGAKRLVITNLYGTSVPDLSWIGALQSLEELGLCSANLKNVTPLGTLSQLKILELCSNPDLTDVSPLARLVNLEELYLSGTKVTDLTPVKSLPKMRVLQGPGD